jgi:hypothetical protein
MKVRDAHAAQSQPRSLFQLAMGPAFERLHPALRRFHSLAGRSTLSGRVRTEPPPTRLGRLLACFTRTPSTAQEGPIRFELDAAPQRERWTRHFPSSTMASTLSLRGGEVIERLGAATLVFELREAEGRLSMVLKRMRFLGIPCPRWLMPRIRAEERGEGDSLHFDIQADVPGCGTVVHYQGWLALPPA